MSRSGKHRRESARGKLVYKNGVNVDSDSSCEESSAVKFGQVQNKKAAKVYVFGNGEIDEEDVLYEATELPEVRSRGKSKLEENHVKRQEPQNDPFLEREVCEGDTLQNIALKYGCRVSELKRLNNLIRDQDFYALTVIKVPVKRFGLLTELVEEEKNGKKLSKLKKNHSEEIEVLEANDYDEEEIDDSDGRSLLVKTVSIRDAFGTQSRDAASFLQRMDTDIHKIISSTKLRMDSLEEVTKSLTCKRIQPFQRQVSWLNGVDCGIRWWSALIFFLIVGLLMPTVFILFVKYGKPDS